MGSSLIFFFLLKDYAKRNRNFMNILIKDSWAVLFYLLETPLLQTAASAFPERRKERRESEVRGRRVDAEVRAKGRA